MPSNEYYDHTTYPGPNAPGSSAALRAELDSIEQGFLKLPTLATNANKVVVVNGAGTGMTTTLSLTGLTLNNTTIGATTPASGSFTTLSASGAVNLGSTVTIAGGTINGTQIGNTTPSSGAFTTLSASSGLTGNVTGNLTGNVTASSGTSTFNNVTVNGTLDMASATVGTISGLLAPTNNDDAANKGYVDTQRDTRLALAGGTMTGAIAMGSNKITGMGTPTASGDAATKGYADTQDALRLALTGGTMSGAIAMGSNKITGMADPTVAQDAATKNYIDTIFGSTASAAASAAAAAASEINAGNSATSASNSASAALTSANNAAASYDSFDDRYLGSKASDPTLDNDGNALLTGALYWNSASSIMKVWTGSAWSATYLPASGYLALSGGTMTGDITFSGTQTFRGLTLTANATGFSVAGGTTSKTLVVNNNLTFSGTDGSTLNIGAGGALGTGAYATIANYATLASPTFTGTPLSTTAAADTNTTQIATTAFVVGQASSTNPVMNGTVAVGTSLRYARADHVHASDTSRAALTANTFTADQTIQANLIFSGTARRITGDFSNATLNSRTLFQSSTTNGETSVGAVPNGTSRVANSAWFNTATPTNSGYLTATISDTQAQIMTGATGSGSSVPLILGTSGTVRVSLGLSGAMDLSTGLREARVAMGANAIDVRAGNYFTKTISGTTTLTVSNVPASGTAASFILDLTNGGSHTITWWSGVKWAGGAAPLLTTSGRDVLGFFTHDGGTTWSGLLIGKDVK